MRLPNPNIYFIDFETRSAADLPKTGAHVYADDLTTDILCLAYGKNNEDIKLWTPKDPLPLELLTHVENGGKVVGHNVAGFERPIWNGVGIRKYKFPELKLGQLECTMAMAYAMALPGSLEKAAAAAGISQLKDAVGKRIMLQVSKPRQTLQNGEIIWWYDEEKFKKLYDYCIQDVKVERELYRRLIKLSKDEREVWLLDQKINERGVQVAWRETWNANLLIQKTAADLDYKMRELTQNQVASCKAVSQLIKFIESKGVKVDSVAKAELSELLEKPDLPKIVREVLLIRQEAAKSSTAKLDSILTRVGNDGRVRGLFQYHGASTGRFAGRGVQIHNLPRSKMKQKQIEEIFQLLKGEENAEL